MDGDGDGLRAQGASRVTLEHGNRGEPVSDACETHGCLYVGNNGGPAAVLAQGSIKRLECVEYPELDMEAI
ncbi:hypothetical protein AGQ63_23570 [Salmonella enterica subsp. enterica]|nr:hypothetical protein AGQ63_23570 [Salmonella enterica subsp. enterica]